LGPKINMVVLHIHRLNGFRGQTGENRPSEPKNGICAPRSVLLCDKSIDREFYTNQEKYTFGAQTGENNWTQTWILGPKINMVV
jgi:hypothetical protein